MRHRFFKIDQAGFTLVELLIATALAALLLTSIAGVAGRAFDSRSLVEERLGQQREARFALERMTMAIAKTAHLVVPLADTPSTPWRENVREQTNPASPPESGSAFATAVLAVTIAADLDLDGNGVMDADNDKDGLIDEDVGADMNNDDRPGLFALDDDGDGKVDESNREDDDEDEDLRGTKDEDPLNGKDDDKDGNIDEDMPADMNGDLRAGVAGEDDDDDGLIDESNIEDDDEDADKFGAQDEDWWDTLAFYLNGTTLMERHPVPWDENLDGKISGLDVIESPLAENVTRLRIERLPRSLSGAQLVAIELELTAASGETVLLQTQMRVGAAR